MNFITMFFKSMRLASELDRDYRVDADPARMTKLIDELSAGEPAPREQAGERHRPAADSVPHPA